MHIRSARESDFPLCAAIDASYDTETAWQMREVSGHKFWGLQFQEVHLPRTQHLPLAPTPEERSVAWTHRDGFWVAVEARDIVAYTSLIVQHDYRQGIIADLVVAPTHRRQGVATQLLQHVSEWGLRKGLIKLRLDVPLKAQPAIAWAQHHHFSLCGFQDGLWPGQETMLFFCKRLIGYPQ